MKLENLHQSCFNTTLMGVLKGVLDFYKISVSSSMLYGGTGHAFLINIHDQICPSGPYCWNYDRFYELLDNFGISMVDLGFFSSESSAKDRMDIETKLKELLTKGYPCSMLNMENQLITGFEDSHFLTEAPWPNNTNFPPRTLTFGSWKEFTDGIHCAFYTFRQSGELKIQQIVKDSLEYALELYLTPEKYTSEPYAGGLQAYDQWIEGIEDGFSVEHGNWWNAMVWGECRAKAAGYIDEIRDLFCEQDPEISDVTDELSRDYRLIASNLESISDNSMDPNQKIMFLTEAKQLEVQQIDRLKKLSKKINFMVG